MSTIVCAHEPDCVSKDCNGHGQCVMGQCVCDSHWTGDSCDVLKCRQHNCSSNGQCFAEGETYVKAGVFRGYTNLFRRRATGFHRQAKPFEPNFFINKFS